MLRRVVMAGLAVVLLASCSSDRDSSTPVPTTPLPETTTTSALPTTPVVARVLSPERGSVQGRGGRGMVVALGFTARDAAALPADFRLGGALPTPAPAAKPGRNPAFPGLVVGLSTTGTALGGPTANLANLFQIVSPSLQLDGSMHVLAVWTNTQVDFGSDIDSTLVAYTVAGSAPDTNPETFANVESTSNIVEVTFRVSPASDAAAAASPTTAAAGATTTSVRPTTTTTRPGTTTPAPTTTRPSTTTRPATTARPTTTTTLFLGLF